jgi:hypothetical protein
MFQRRFPIFQAITNCGGKSEEQIENSQVVTSSVFCTEYGKNMLFSLNFG